jgi:hypothetical protein
MEGRPIRDSRVVLTQLMGPNDAIPGQCPRRHHHEAVRRGGRDGGYQTCRRPAVTVTVDSMSFHSPVHIGNLVTVRAEVTWVGRTSMETRVVVTAENVLTGSGDPHQHRLFCLCGVG